MKVVIDTNIIVSSFFGGNPKKIIDLLDVAAIRLCISGPIMKEYLRTFSRFEFKRFNIEKILFYCSEADAVDDSLDLPTLQLVADPDDDKFIECAVALEADFIISGDKALLEVGHYKKIKIVTPKQFLDIFQKKQ